MTTELELASLADRVEGLSGPDREIDAQILRLCFADTWKKLCIEAGEPCGAPEHVMQEGAAGYVLYRRQYWFTGSLNAARALIPEGWWLYAVDGSVSGRFYVSLRGPLMPCNDPDGEGIIAVPAMAAGCSKLLKTAITAAALRARAASC